MTEERAERLYGSCGLKTTPTMMTANQSSLPEGRNLTTNQSSLPERCKLTANQHSLPERLKLTTNQCSLPAVHSESQQQEKVIVHYRDNKRPVHPGGVFILVAILDLDLVFRQLLIIFSHILVIFPS